jgi:hypothetical protein
MALVLKDRVQETGTANTTVSFTLAGAVAGYQSFSAIGNTNTTYYAATDTYNNWETGLGTYSTTGPTLTRTTVLSSSNSGSAVTFTDTVNVFCTYPSSRSLYLNDASTGVNVSQAAFTSGGAVYATSTTALTSGTLPLTAGGTNATSSIGALTSLGAAARGANTDITSIALTSGTITTAPTADTDIVNKLYADSIAEGINFHKACDYATTVALPTAYTYNNGTSGVGATITANAVGTLTIDGDTFDGADVGKRILIKNETGDYVNTTTPSAAFNGVYTLTTAGTGSAAYVLTRATDFDTAGTGVDVIAPGDFFLVTSGTVNANTAWIQQTPLPITVGTTGITFIQFGGASGGVSSFSAGSTGFTPNSATSGAVTLGGQLAIGSGGTGATTLAGASIATYTGTETLTNKRIDPRVVLPNNATTPLTSSVLSIASGDIYAYTALSTNLTINAPGGTPLDGDKLIFRILDNGTARTLTWNATYTAIGVTLPTTTTVNKTTYVGCIYNANNTRWDVVAVTTQA